MSIIQEIQNLHLKRVDVSKVENKGDRSLIYITGGFNGTGEWDFYLQQMQEIVKVTNGWIVSLKNDCSDDIWYLVIGTTKPC